MQLPEIDVNERVNKNIKELVKPWGYLKSKKYCLKNGNLVDVVNGVTIENTTILIEDGIIKCVLTDCSECPAEYEIIDCSEKFLCPGLFDNHVHLQCVPGEIDLSKLMLMSKDKAMMRVGFNSKLMLKRGFTSLRDCGGTTAFVKNAIEEGSIIGPRLFIAGHAISQTGGHGHMVPSEFPGDAFDSCSCHMNLLGVVADGVAECYKAAREELRQGADFIKIMASGGVASPTDKITNLQYCDDEIQALVRIADSYGTYVTAHAYTPESIKNCLRNGVKGIEHGNLLDEETARMMAEEGCYLTPTLVTYKIMASDQFKGFLDESSQEKNYQVLKRGLASLLIAKRNNVKVCFGTDLLGSLGGYQTQEFFIRSKILKPQEILLSATVIPAEMNRVDNILGQIKPGFLADVLLLKSNPLEDITILDDPENQLVMVMKEGRILVSSDADIKTDVDN